MGMKLVFVLLLLCGLEHAQAVEISALGYGGNPAQAKQEAREQLAVLIFKQFQAKYCHQQSGREQALCSSIWSPSEIPLIQPKLKIVSKAPWTARASLDTKAVKRYQAKLHESASSNTARSGATPGNATSVINRAAHRLVLLSLMPEQALSADTEPLQTKGGLPGLPKVVNLPELVEDITTHTRDLAPMVILPATYRQFREITPFAAVLSESLRSQLRHRQSSDLILLLQYDDPSQDNIPMRYRLIKRHDSVLRAGEFLLPTATISGLRYLPSNRAFETALDTNISPGTEAANDSDTGIRARLFTDHGSDKLLFKKGDIVKLFVNLNRPGYFFLVGHVKQEQQEYSYLLDIGDREPQFVYRVDESATSRDIELGEFDVAAPFGTEYLQLIYSVSDLKSKLPATRWDDKLGYFVIQGSENNMQQGLERIRGLTRRCGPMAAGKDCQIEQKHQAAKLWEVALSYTTMDIPCGKVRGLERNCSVKPAAAMANTKDCRPGERGLARNCTKPTAQAKHVNQSPIMQNRQLTKEKQKEKPCKRERGLSRCLSPEE